MDIQYHEADKQPMTFWPFILTDPRPWYERLFQLLIMFPRYIITGKLHIGCWIVKNIETTGPT